MTDACIANTEVTLSDRSNKYQAIKCNRSTKYLYQHMPFTLALFLKHSIGNPCRVTFDKIFFQPQVKQVKWHSNAVSGTFDVISLYKGWCTEKWKVVNI